MLWGVSREAQLPAPICVSSSVVLQCRVCVSTPRDGPARLAPNSLICQAIPSLLRSPASWLPRKHLKWGYTSLAAGLACARFAAPSRSGTTASGQYAGQRSSLPWISVGAAIVGCGGVASAAAWTLGLLSLTGNPLVVDHDTIDEEGGCAHVSN